MRVRRRCAAFSLMVFVTASALAADVSTGIDKLKKNGLPGDVWFPRSAISADFTCDGKPDFLVRGQRGQSALVGLLPSDEKGQNNRPSIVDVSVLDQKSVLIVKETQVCEDEFGPLEGCKPRRGCVQFRVERDGIDSLHCWWNARRKEIGCWMR